MSWQTKCLSVAAATLLASTAMAQEHVKWNDDGTVDLMLGPDYDNTVITVDQEQLGSLFGPDEKPFEGEEITVLTLDRRPERRYLRADQRVPAGLGGTDRRHARHRARADHRSLRQDDARPERRPGPL